MSKSAKVGHSSKQARVVKHMHTAHGPGTRDEDDDAGSGSGKARPVAPTGIRIACYLVQIVRAQSGLHKKSQQQPPDTLGQGLSSCAGRKLVGRRPTVGREGFAGKTTGGQHGGKSGNRDREMTIDNPL